MKWFMKRLRALFQGKSEFYYVEERRDYEHQLEENKLKRAV